MELTGRPSVHFLLSFQPSHLVSLSANYCLITVVLLAFLLRRLTLSTRHVKQRRSCFLRCLRCSVCFSFTHPSSARPSFDYCKLNHSNGYDERMALLYKSWLTPTPPIGRYNSGVSAGYPSGTQSRMPSQPQLYQTHVMLFISRLVRLAGARIPRPIHRDVASMSLVRTASASSPVTLLPLVAGTKTRIK